MKKTLVFQQPSMLQTGRDAIEYLFPYTLVDSSLVGAPEEKSRTSHFRIMVGASRTLHSCWELQEDQFERVLFEYGKRHVIEKIRDRTLSDKEELLLHTGNTEIPCPFDPSRIPSPVGATLEVEVGESKLLEDPSLLQLATLIIDARDNINALFNAKHKEKLIMLREERDLLNFFREASSHEELAYRVCSLTNAAIGMNVEALRKITGKSDPNTGSIDLLAEYLSQNGFSDKTIIEILRAVNKLRQAYPVHGDRAKGVLKAHEFFGLTYPCTDFRRAWRTFLSSYLDVLQRLLEKIKG